MQPALNHGSEPAQNSRPVIRLTRKPTSRLRVVAITGRAGLSHVAHAATPPDQEARRRTPWGGGGLFSRTNRPVGNTGFEPVTSTV